MDIVNQGLLRRKRLGRGVNQEFRKSIVSFLIGPQPGDDAEVFERGRVAFDFVA